MIADTANLETAGDRARAERVAQGLPPMIEDEPTLRRLAAIFSASTAVRSTGDAA